MGPWPAAWNALGESHPALTQPRLEMKASRGTCTGARSQRGGAAPSGSSPHPARPGPARPGPARRRSSRLCRRQPTAGPGWGGRGGASPRSGPGPMAGVPLLGAWPGPARRSPALYLCQPGWARTTPPAPVGRLGFRADCRGPSPRCMRATRPGGWGDLGRGGYSRPGPIPGRPPGSDPRPAARVRSPAWTPGALPRLRLRAPAGAWLRLGEHDSAIDLRRREYGFA